MSMKVHEFNVTFFYGLNTMEDKAPNDTPLFRNKSDLYKWNGLKIAQWFPVASVISSIYQVIDGGKDIILNPDVPISYKIAFIARLILSIAAPILLLIDLAITGIKKCLKAKEEHENNQNTHYPIHWKESDSQTSNIESTYNDHNNSQLPDIEDPYEDTNNDDNYLQLPSIDNVSLQNHMYSG
jgi:hypothetical protein